MKKITDSLLKRIVRQSLNESYGLLNEDDKKPGWLSNFVSNVKTNYKNNKQNVQCLDGIFCLGDGSLSKAQELSRTLTQVGGGSQGIVTRGWKVIDALKSNCDTLKYGAANESIASQAVEDIGLQYSNTNTDEDVVKKTILKLNYPEWCMVIELAQQKGYADGDDFWNKTTVGTDDYSIYVVNPSLQVLRNTIKKTETREIKYNEEIAAKQKEIDDNFKKSGWATKDEWQKSGWKVKPIDYTIGGGGANSVSFEGYECISNHPALIKTPVKNFPNGVGYKLSTNNQTIDKFIFGVQKQGTGDTAIDQGVMMKDDGSGIAVNFNCPSKYLQYSLSTIAWDYNAVIDSNGKIALTTDPAREERFTNESYRHKGFRHNLLTEIELKYDKDKPQRGVEVGNIMSKLLLPAEKNPTFGPQVLAAVINHQKTEGAKLTPPLRTDGVVDDATYASIMAIQPPPFELSAAKKSKGDDVTLIQKQLGAKGGTFGTDTETKVKEFQTNYGTTVTPALRTDGVVDQATFDLIKKFKGPDSRKVFSGKKHNYVAGNWIKVTPETADEQLSGNDGFFKILSVTEYTVVIDAAFFASGTTGGSTQRVLFGEDAKEGTQEVIKRDRNNDNNNNDNNNNNNNNNKGTRSNTNNSGTNTVNTEKQKQRDVRNKEFCDTLRQVKQYINDKKGGDLTVNCKKTQKTLNQIMMAITGGTIGAPVAPVAPVEVPDNTPGGNNVRIF